MSSTTMRLVGIICLVAAAVLFILNLQRVANLGTFWVALPLLLAGAVLVARSRRHN
ncbi:MAG TPA: hypothetical protein VLU47_15905 [Blastocatellia bacterium]|nr:hypothetical protein [Blastocatellia bacterium]